MALEDSAWNAIRLMTIDGPTMAKLFESKVAYRRMNGSGGDGKVLSKYTLTDKLWNYLLAHLNTNPMA